MQKPNVILMLIDDLGYGDLSCLNESSRVKTTNIDALAECGMVFRDAHSSSALCTPSRYSLLTGRYNWRSRLKLAVLPGGGAPLIEPGKMTIANLFKDEGYFTACIGKWHLGMGWQRKQFDGSEYGIENECKEKTTNPYRYDALDIDFDKPLTFSPNDYGFDYFFGQPGSLDQPPYTHVENDKMLHRPDHVSGIWPIDRSGPIHKQAWQRGPHAKEFKHEEVVPLLQEKVLKLIDEHADEPFFIYYPTHAVHGPIFPPGDFLGKSGVNVYLDMVLYVDEMVRQITEKLKEKGIWENTIFVFASDNGCAGVADYPLLTSRGHNPSYVFRGMKSDVYEGGHRVPTIISWPKKWAERQNCDQMICLSDLFATFSDILGTKLPDNVAEDSFSMMSLLDGIDSPIRKTIVHHPRDGSFSIRNSKWKLVLGRGDGGMNNTNLIDPSTTDEVPYLLYDLNTDIGERYNRAASHPDVIKDLKRQMIELIENGRSTPGPKLENTPVKSWPQYEALKANA